MIYIVYSVIVVVAVYIQSRAVKCTVIVQEVERPIVPVVNILVNNLTH